MNNFISLLDNTLQLNKEEDKSDEEIPEVKDESEETPRIPKSSSMPSMFIIILLYQEDKLDIMCISLLCISCVYGPGTLTYIST